MTVRPVVYQGVHWREDMPMKATNHEVILGVAAAVLVVLIGIAIAWLRGVV
jgi:hypothetical protein